jgi:hypothetical protein
LLLAFKKIETKLTYRNLVGCMLKFAVTYRPRHFRQCPADTQRLTQRKWYVTAVSSHCADTPRLCHRLDSAQLQRRTEDACVTGGTRAAHANATPLSSLMIRARHCGGSLPVRPPRRHRQESAQASSPAPTAGVARSRDFPSRRIRFRAGTGGGADEPPRPTLRGTARRHRRRRRASPRGASRAGAGA